MPTKVLVTDLDGTLVDTSTIIPNMFAQLSLEYAGRELDWGMVAKGTHGTLRAFVARVIDKPIGHPLVEEAIERMHAIRIEQLHLVTAYPHAVEVLKGLHERSIPVGVVTSGDRRTVTHLDHAGLGEYVSVRVTPEDVTYPKPHPESILYALTQMGFDATADAMRNVIVLGDTPSDIAAGRAAGATTVAAAWGFGTLLELQAAEPDHIINGLDELPAFLR